jgi:hypothetical protein
MSDNSDSDSDVSTTSLHKQLQPSAVVVTGDSESSTEEEESELKSSDDKTVICGVKLIYKPCSEPFLGNTSL